MNAPCKVSVASAFLASGGAVNVYPRVLIMRQDFVNAGPSSYCEYGDGTGPAAAFFGPVPAQAPSATPAPTPLTLNIGGSGDCGPNSTSNSSSYPANTFASVGAGGAAGAVAQIIVPAGYYDVHTTFTFIK